MSLGGVLTPSAVLLPLLLVLCASPSGHGASTHNITDILAAHPEFAEFSAALNSTGAASEIDHRNSITVLAVNNTVMAAARGLHPEDLKRVISLHVLLDYFDDAKLSSIHGGFVHAATLYQASGKAPESDGILNITTDQAGRVAFTAPPAASGTMQAAAFYEKTVVSKPYVIAVLQVSALISSPLAGVQAPAPAPHAPAPAPVAVPATSPATPAPAPVRAPATSPATPAPAPVRAPATSPATPAPAPVRAPGAAPATPAPAPVRAPAAAPATLAPAPVVTPATAPTPRRRPAPEPVSARAPSPDADDNPPADQKNKGARDTASWTLGETVVAAALPAIVLVL